MPNFVEMSFQLKFETMQFVAQERFIFGKSYGLPHFQSYHQAQGFWVS
jgi:hypothetical protein